jgi:hypothetical protein
MKRKQITQAQALILGRLHTDFAISFVISELTRTSTRNYWQPICRRYGGGHGAPPFWLTRKGMLKAPPGKRLPL